MEEMCELYEKKLISSHFMTVFWSADEPVSRPSRVYIYIYREREREIDNKVIQVGEIY